MFSQRCFKWTQRTFRRNFSSFVRYTAPDPGPKEGKSCQRVKNSRKFVYIQSKFLVELNFKIKNSSILLFWTSINFPQKYRQIEYSKMLFVILNFLSKIRQTRISQFSRILHFLNFEFFVKISSY